MPKVACRKPKNNPNENKLVSRFTVSLGYTSKVQSSESNYHFGPQAITSKYWVEC